MTFTVTFDIVRFRKPTGGVTGDHWSNFYSQQAPASSYCAKAGCKEQLLQAQKEGNVTNESFRFGFRESNRIFPRAKWHCCAAMIRAQGNLHN